MRIFYFPRARENKSRFNYKSNLILTNYWLENSVIGSAGSVTHTPVSLVGSNPAVGRRLFVVNIKQDVLGG